VRTDSNDLRYGDCGSADSASAAQQKAAADRPSKNRPAVLADSSESATEFAWHATGDLAWKVAQLVALMVATRATSEAHATAYILMIPVLAVLLAFGDLGFCAIGTRLLARGGREAELLRIRSIVQQKRLLSAALIGLPLATLAMREVNDQADVELVIAFLIVCWLPSFAMLDWALLGLRRFRTLALARICASVVVIAGSLIGAFVSLGVWAVGASLATGLALQAVIGWRDVGRTMRTRPPLPVYPQVGQLEANDRALGWYASTGIAAGFAANALFHAQEALLAGWALGSEAATDYVAATRPIMIVCAVVWAGVQYFAPQFARDSGRRINFAGLRGPVFCVTAIGIVLALSLWAVGPLLSQMIYGGRFPAASEIIRLLSVTVALDAIVALLGTLLVMRGQVVASLASLCFGCAASFAGFWIAWLAGADSLTPVIAKVCGYVGLLGAQCLILALGLRRRH
jgi:O-antigen/teichoic acid export membrane protein